MLTNDVPQCNHIVFARGRQWENGGFARFPDVVKEIKGFNFLKSFQSARIVTVTGAGTVIRRDALRTGAAHAVEVWTHRSASPRDDGRPAV